jgi:hypothetical protein
VRVQLRRHERICTAVTAATAALLGTGARADSNKVESSMLLYSETNRVKAAEGVIHFTRQEGDRRTYGVDVTVDGLTGASPNGATPSSRAQTFTGPSGSRGYTAPPGGIPLDNSFHDTRFAVDGSMTSRLDRLTSLTLGAHVSIEHDYNSIGANAGLQRDFFQKNTTLGFSAAYSHDTVSPIGGAPVPLASMPPPNSEPRRGEEVDDGAGSGPGKGKDLVDAVFGITQVLGRSTLLQVDYSVSHAAGYLTDPYKILSVVEDWGSTSPGDPADYLYESRPAARTKQAVYSDLRRDIAGTTLDLAYRYFWDDWGVTSHSVDAFYRLPVGGGRALEPHVRWYRQTAADFYRTYLVQGRSLPRFASADSRLAAFDALTFGLKYSFPLRNLDRLAFSAEYYTQLGSRGPPDAIGILSQYDLFPKLDVFMLRVGYTREF